MLERGHLNRLVPGGLAGVILVVAHAAGAAPLLTGTCASCEARRAAADSSGEVWRMAEFAFTASSDYAAGGGDAVRFDASFSNRTSSAVMVRPGFWDGGRSFLVRFAPPQPGVWDWRTVSDDAALNEKTGSFEALPYGGPHAIYRHGFLKAERGKKYLLHADGTPFFYLGDTHWGMYREELDEPGPHAGGTGATSHFKYIVDRRVQQGFTVYQSEPIDAAFHLEDGHVDAADIAGFRQADRYYRYLADAGLVHANAEFFFTASMTDKLARDEAALERLSRYWVARFGAFPVLWTLAQEMDNDFYFEQAKSERWSFKDNPWVKVAEYLHRYDAYAHPLSGHQESAWNTSVTGAGTNSDRSKISGDGKSVFLSEDVARRTGHNWWAAQWSPNLTHGLDLAGVRDYWASPRPAVCYEGRYCGLWTKDYGARAQGWISLLSGFCGYGYGAIDQWLYKSTYQVDKPSHDGVETITIEDKARPWCESLEYPSARQMTHLKKFFTSFDWWNLKPDFEERRTYDTRDVVGVHAVAGKRHVFYFYGKGRRTLPVSGLDPDAFYTLRWFDPRAGEWGEESIVRPDADGRFVPPARPDEQDWALELFPCGNLKLVPGKPVVLDFGPRGVAGYPTLAVERTVLSGTNARVRVSYSTHPDGLGEKGDFWRETAARYLGEDVDLPILPANIDRYEFFDVKGKGVLRSPLVQGLVRYVRLCLESPTGEVTVSRMDFANDRVCSTGERTGRFDCSDTTLTAVWEASVRTCELSSIPSYDSIWGARKGPTLPYVADGAKRDRLVWSGDLWWAERSCFYGFRPTAPYMRGSVEMLAANQTPEGYVQASPWPDQDTPKAGEWGPFGSDEFACWFVPVAWDYYLHTADEATARKVYPVVCRLMAYLMRYQNAETGIFEQRKETSKHAAGLVFGDTSLHHRSYMNILLWKTFVDAAAFAERFGERRTGECERWRAAADRLARSVRSAFWDEDEGRFCLSAEDRSMGFEANALALATRFATEDEAAQIMRRLVRTDHGKFQALAARGKCEYGALDAALRCIDAHGWRKVFDPDWQGVQLTSECMGLIRKGWGDEAHPDTAIAGLLTNYLLGIRPARPGFSTFVFKVPETRRITWASGLVPTPHGAINASWLRKTEGLEVNLGVPKGTRCFVSVPGEEPVEVGPGGFHRLYDRFGK